MVAHGCRSLHEGLALKLSPSGTRMPDMPLFLAPELYVMVPLEVTYQSAWDAVPTRWQRVIASAN